MIRINLHPSTQKRATPSKPKALAGLALPTTQVSRGSVLAVALLLGWVALGVVGWLLYSNVQEEVETLKADAAKVANEAKELSGKTNLAELEEAAARLEQLNAAVDLLETKRRTPIYVLHELATVLTTGKTPIMDEAAYRQRVNLDRQAELDPNWDATSVWLTEIVEAENGVLEITGGTRDPDDLSEFVKRLRASARIDRVSHPEFKLQAQKQAGGTNPRDPKPGAIDQDFYTFELTVQVGYWD